MSTERFLLAAVAFTVMATAALASLPCPEPADIAPCECYLVSYNQMHFDCTAVLSEEQLAEVFTAPLPYKDFSMFKMYNNNNIKVLRNGVFGNATFQKIQMIYGSLVEVQEEALSGSYNTLDNINLHLNQLTSFPFSHLPNFTALNRLSLSYNSLAQMPPLKSNTLMYLGMEGNPLAHVQVNAVQQLPSLMYCNFDNTGVTTIYPGTLTGLDGLEMVYLSGNAIQHLGPGSIQVSRRGYVSLGYNNLTSIGIGAITGLAADFLELGHNSLTVLDEAVFRPLLEQFSYVRIEDNPLACGCDVAWLITNPALMAHLWGTETCFNGDWLIDLDPATYDDCPTSGHVSLLDHAP